MPLSQFSDIIASLALIVQIFSVLVLIAVFIPRIHKHPKFQAFFKNYGLFAAFFVALFATAASLTYAEYYELAPCKLCWLQRIFIFPQVVLLGIAAVRKDLAVWWYSLPVAAIGLAISIYHYLVQQSDSITTSCSTLGQSASCGDTYILEFGYLSIPMMAITTSLFIIVMLLGVVRSE